MANHRTSLLGILFGLIAGAAWGLVFLIPTMLSSFSSLEITLGRYFMYGLYSLLLFVWYRKNSFRISPKVWFRAFLYAFAGNIGYFFFLVIGMKYAGTAVATLMVGTLPLTISFFGNLLYKEFPFKIMLIPACSILVGIILMYLERMENGGGADLSSDGFLLGFLSCLICIVLWTWYAVSNANFLKSEPRLSADLFATIIGIQTLLFVIATIFIAWMAKVPIVENLIFHDQLLHYLIGVLVLGVVASWMASWAWNQASKRLPVSLAGMVIVFETLFGLLYTYVYRSQFPTVLEWGSIVFILLGVISGIWRISAHRIPTKAAEVRQQHRSAAR